MSVNEDERVSVYMSSRTRARLNVYRSFCGLAQGGSVSQDAAATQLLDMAGVPSAAVLLSDLNRAMHIADEIDNRE